MSATIFTRVIDRLVRIYSTPALQRLEAIAKTLAAMDTKLDQLVKGETTIMATEADLNSKLDTLSQAIANEIATAKADIQAAIQQGSTPAQISDATMARLDQLTQTVQQAFGPPPAPAAAAPATATAAVKPA